MLAARKTRDQKLCDIVGPVTAEECNAQWLKARSITAEADLLQRAGLMTKLTRWLSTKGIDTGKAGDLGQFMGFDAEGRVTLDLDRIAAVSHLGRGGEGASALDDLFAPGLVSAGERARLAELAKVGT